MQYLDFIPFLSSLICLWFGCSYVSAYLLFTRLFVCALSRWFCTLLVSAGHAASLCTPLNTVQIVLRLIIQTGYLAKWSVQFVWNDWGSARTCAKIRLLVPAVVHTSHSVICCSLFRVIEMTANHTHYKLFQFIGRFEWNRRTSQSPIENRSWEIHAWPNDLHVYKSTHQKGGLVFDTSKLAT